MDRGKAHSTAAASNITVEAVKILKDGTRVPLGIVSCYHRNPIKRIRCKLSKKCPGLDGEKR